MLKLIEYALESLFPTRCASCDMPAPPGQLLCELCVVSLVPGAEVCCPRCGLIYLEPPPGGGQHLCGECLRDPPPWRRARAAFAYGGALADAIARWKNRPEQALGPPLAALMLGEARAAAWRSLPPRTLVVPVPSQRRALRRRGFNPAGVLARQVARGLGLESRPTALRLQRALASTQGLDRRARRRRARGAFVARSAALKGRRVLLIDDVMTTGATAAAATKALLAGGALDVEVAVLARALLS